MSDIRVVDVGFDDILGVERVAAELGVTDNVARTLMAENVIKSIRVNGYYTKRELLDRYKKQRAEL